MWKKNEPSRPASPPVAPTPAPREPQPRPEKAVVGGSIRIQGELTGEEDLEIRGRVEGAISLSKHDVLVGESGRVKADIRARSIRVAGEVEGDLIGEEEVVILKTGRVVGNIVAARVSLENGSKFKGSIDMEPKRGAAGPPARTEPKREETGPSASRAVASA